MDYQLFLEILEKTRHHRDDQFLEIEVPYNGTMGLIHLKNAELLLGHDDLMSKGIFSFGRGGQLIIGQGYTTAQQVTDALQHITDTLRTHNRIKPITLDNPVEYARIVREWDDRPWNEIKDHTPVCDSATLQALGFPRFNCHCVALKVINGQVHIVFGERGEGTYAGEWDNAIGGKMEAEKTRDENMQSETGQETKLKVTIDGKINNPLYLGTIYTLRQKDKSIFNRHISVYLWLMKPDDIPQPNDEVMHFHTLPFDSFMDCLRDPAQASRFPYFVPLDVFYAVAKYLKTEYDNGALNGDDVLLNKHSIRLLNLVIDEAESAPTLIGTGHATLDFINSVGERLAKISKPAYGR